MAIFIGRRPETAFTRVPNEWARDPKLSFKAKGLLTYLLSHQDGYRLTVEQVVAEATDGKAAVYSAIKELVEHGYVERVQRRGERGKVGEVGYYVADAPGETASQLSASGKPESGDDLGKQEETAGETASRFSASGLSGSGKSTTKKTRVKKTKVLEDQNTISLSGSADDATAATVPAPRTERENEEASLRTETKSLLVEAGCPVEELDDMEKGLRRRHVVRSPSAAWFRESAKNGDLPALVADVRPALQPSFPEHQYTDAHPFEPSDHDANCKRCLLPPQNGRHKVGNQGGGYNSRRGGALDDRKPNTHKHRPFRNPTDPNAYEGVL